MMKKEKDHEQKLEAWFSGAERVAVVGVGNTMRRDDAVGVEIAKLLQGKVSSDVLLIEAETMPENCIDQVVDFHPSHVLILDSGLIGGKPGNVKLLAPTESMKAAVSSHMLPLQVFCAYLNRAANAKILMLIIRPKDTGIGERLTIELAKAAKETADFLVKLLP
jgi:hydrogenase 3 maturation protease